MSQKRIHISKNTLYELYWGEQMNLGEVAEELNISKKTVRRKFKEYNIPQASKHMHELFIFSHRSREYLYDLYWTQDQTFQEIADQFPFSYNRVKEKYHNENIPVDSPTRKDRWYDKDRGIPNKYKLPSDDTSVTEDDTLPDDPDGSKYMADTPLHRDKDRLYQLYWGYGLSASQIRARSKYDVKIKDEMQKLGIPTRDYHEHVHWKPYHGVPPKYEWQGDDEEENTHHMTWRSPSTAD